MSGYRKKLIEVALPLDAINRESAREKSIRHGHPSTLHLWWARRPLAACRAVLFAQLVDDPSAWPEYFPTEGDQERERLRLFRLIEELVKWDNINDEVVLDRARLEIARSLARGRLADGAGDERDRRILGDGVAPEQLRTYLAEIAPPVCDPFCGGGSIPLEAQRLGLRTIASDLNPVAVLITKALVEIPPRFAGRSPVHPKVRKRLVDEWRGAQGLAEDVRRYGEWMRNEAFRRIGHLYPKVRITPELVEGRPDLAPYLGQELTVIAWLWARTVPSPDPAFADVEVPLISSFWLSKKRGKEAWLWPVVDREARTWRLEVHRGEPPDRKAVDAGTKRGRGAYFRCLLSNTPIEPDHVKRMGREGRMGARLMAIVLEGRRERLYLPALQEHETVARQAQPKWKPEGSVPARLTGGTCYGYGLTEWGDLFTPRQLVALTTFSDLVREVREKIEQDAIAAGLPDDGVPLRNGGHGAKAYAEAVGVYLAMAVSKVANIGSTITSWMNDRGAFRETFSRQAIPMVWDYAEANLFAGIGGSINAALDKGAMVLDKLSINIQGNANQRDAAIQTIDMHTMISCDPPYYDNIGYSDLSDFFYVWLRQMLRTVYPDLFSTMLVPKANELVASPYRHGSRKAAERFFLLGMKQAITNIAHTTVTNIPVTIYYAFKQKEHSKNGTGSTGWETFLEATIKAGFSITGTWPIRTEGIGRILATGTNALASSIVLACRKRPADAPTITRADFRRLLRHELPHALRRLQQGNVAPVDLAQAAIGPGMEIFSRHAKVIEADGSTMSVRTALQLINQALDEYLAEQEGEVDADTRFAVTWFENYQYQPGPYGEAETLAKARNVSVQGVCEAGILHAAGGKVRLLRREELPDDWEPSSDERLTVWEAMQHLIKRLEGEGEEAAAALLAQLGETAGRARDLAYRLYTTCERRGWAEEARAYNALVVSWPEIEKLAVLDAGAIQADLFEPGE